jgi:uroporphyrinogen decarboxylase
MTIYDIWRNIMKQFNLSYTKLDAYAGMNNRPDFNNLIKIMKHQKPLRPTIFEYFLNDNIYNYISQFKKYDSSDPLLFCKKQIDTFHMLGYDYATIMGADFFFKNDRHYKAGAKSISINEGGVISDWESFEKYEWPDPEDYDFSRLEKLKDYLPEGMKILLSDFNGILEQTIELVGYENLCFMTVDEPELAKAIFDKVGEIHVKYHKISKFAVKAYL